MRTRENIEELVGRMATMKFLWSRYGGRVAGTFCWDIKMEKVLK